MGKYKIGLLISRSPKLILNYELLFQSSLPRTTKSLGSKVLPQLPNTSAARASLSGDRNYRTRRYGENLTSYERKSPGCRIYLCHQTVFPQTRNITSRQKAIELFAAEAVILDELGRHPQIPQLYDYFTQNEHQYLVQEWIEGDNLTQVLQKQGTFDEKRICQLLNALLPVLAFVHQHQIIHRDIKPENILSCSDGTLVLVDFGAAKAVSARALDRTGTIIGSPEYIAPEQLRGKAVISSDIYSLGVTCLHLLTGISPFDLYSDSEDAWVWQDYLASNSISEELGQILDKMIIRAISQRYQSASAVLGDLNANCVYSLELASNCPEKAFEFVPAEPKSITLHYEICWQPNNGNKPIKSPNVYYFKQHMKSEKIG